MYRMTDAEFKEALREAVIKHACSMDGPYGGIPPVGFKPIHPVWRSGYFGPVDREMTLQRGPYSFLTPEQKAALLAEE